jgi:hypothetical protein
VFHKLALFVKPLGPQKHALLIRTCRCGRRVAGNIFFKHLRHCRVLKQRAMSAAA